MATAIGPMKNAARCGTENHVQTGAKQTKTRLAGGTGITGLKKKFGSLSMITRHRSRGSRVNDYRISN